MLIERIKRKIEPGLGITPGTTPVVYFGNYEKAKVCTVSLNPSNIEFVNNRRGILLDNLNKERLCSRIKLNKRDDEELSDSEAEQVLQYCNNYFQLRPYSWFNNLEHFIKRFNGYSYKNGTCVHLDLVQWATTPKWNDLDVDIRQKHIDNDKPVLLHLLEKNFEYIFLNGRTVAETVFDHLGIARKEITTSYSNINSNDVKRIKIYCGKYNNSKVLGWNLTLQNSVPGENNIQLFCDLIKNNIKEVF